MTLARYQGTGLAEVTAPPGMRRTPRWWRQLSCSRYCPRCLAANGGRWMLAWRIPWPSPAPAARSCSPTPAPAARRPGAPAPASPASPAAATSPACPCRHRARPAPPPSCTSDPARHPSRRTAGRRARAGRPAARRRPHLRAARLTGTAPPRTQPRCGSNWTTSTRSPALPPPPVNGQAVLPPAAEAILGELAARPGAPAPQGRGSAGSAADRPGGPTTSGSSRPWTAFGTAVADIMLHGRGR